MRRRFFSEDRIFIAAILAPLVLLLALLIYGPAVDTFRQSLTNRNLRIQ